MEVIGGENPSETIISVHFMRQDIEQSNEGLDSEMGGGIEQNTCDPKGSSSP